MTQIYYALRLLKDQDIVYDQLAEMIVKIYGKDARYLEICGGVYPALAHALSKQLTTGEIITYDGALSRAPEAHIFILIRHTFLMGVIDRTFLGAVMLK